MKQVQCLSTLTAHGLYFFDYGNAFLLESSRAGMVSFNFIFTFIQLQAACLLGTYSLTTDQYCLIVRNITHQPDTSKPVPASQLLSSLLCNMQDPQQLHLSGYSFYWLTRVFWHLRLPAPYLSFSLSGADVYDGDKGKANEFKYPSYVQHIMGDIFSLGFGPFRWVCTSCDPEDLTLTDQIAAEVLESLASNANSKGACECVRICVCIHVCAHIHLFTYVCSWLE